METTEKRHGSTSIGLPGINGDAGERARIFFYGNINYSGSQETLVFYTPNDSDESSRGREAVIPQGTIPEPYDYIFYTDNEYDHIYVIKSVTYEQGAYLCYAEEIDRINLSVVEPSYSGLTNFMLNIVKVGWTRTVRVPKSWTASKDKTQSTYYCYPVVKQETTFDYLYNFSVAVPSTSDYKFKSDIKITIEFNTIQSAQMDSTIASRFANSSQIGDTYRGNIENYNIAGQLPSSFDDERLENFVIVVKDYEDGVDSTYFTNSIPIMSMPLRRYASNPKAYVCIYTKYDDGFIKKSVVSELNINSLLYPTDMSPSSIDEQSSDEQPIQPDERGRR